MEFKKHRTQMTVNEQSFLKHAIKKRIARFNTSTHFEARLKERTNLSTENVTDLINKGFNVIECHNLKGTVRVLIECQKIVRNHKVKIVLDLERHTIVTVYLNHKYDTHRTLDKDAYFNTDFYLYDKIIL